MIISSTVF